MTDTSTPQLVAKLWSFCHVLRDDGLSYLDYTEQLTYLLFLKMADERAALGLPGPEIPGEANGIRIGTQEVTRWGMGVVEMAEIASLVARVLVQNESVATVRADVVQFRQRFQQLHFVRN